MTVLAVTASHLVEFESGLLSVIRWDDGRALSFTGRRVAGEFRDCLRSHGAERATATFIRIAGPGADWTAPPYKPSALARMRAELTA